MPRLLFQKTGNAVWISHLDLMRMFQRAFKRAGLPLTHTHGFNPRPSVSIALPLSVGIDSYCELLDFELDGQSVPMDEIRDRLNKKLIGGVRVLSVYEDGRKIKYLALLRCCLMLRFDDGVPCEAEDRIRQLLERASVMVPKKTKTNGIQDQDIIPMIRSFTVHETDRRTLALEAVICCQNPTLNPMQIVKAIELYLPDLPVAFVKCTRMEIYDQDEQIFR